MHRLLSSSAGSLRAIKTIHTVVWAFFVACILAIPTFAWQGRFGFAWTFVGIVAVEVLVLVVNSWTCPLTGVASRYTEDRRPNFDIYLPEWLAHYNKVIFGTLYVASVAFVLLRWFAR